MVLTVCQVPVRTRDLEGKRTVRLDLYQSGVDLEKSREHACGPFSGDVD